ncbi:MAG: hypothetical protein H0V34_03540 [Gammaproteobacteria bacterium]|nr:hypothetical protein [Gammaproteobacteria bacterium]MBA3731498.1 hypothetical protein [Gammaproteobacteria bacterium]
MFVPLRADDPLAGDGPDNIPNSGDETNFMVLTRARNQVDPDGTLGTADDIHEHTNTTTAFVDQNQTYTSHPSHQVFLREYVLNAAGDPVATGKMLEGAAGGLANWAEVKTQAATILGIQLDDQDVLNVPLLATDQYGNFIPGGSGIAAQGSEPHGRGIGLWIQRAGVCDLLPPHGRCQAILGTARSTVSLP